MLAFVTGDTLHARKIISSLVFSSSCINAHIPTRLEIQYLPFSELVLILKSVNSQLFQASILGWWRVCYQQVLPCLVFASLSTGFVKQKVKM